MRTHLDFGFMTARQQACNKFAGNFCISGCVASLLAFDPRYNWPFDSFIQVYLFHLSNLSFLYCKNNQMFSRLFIV